MGRTFAQKFEDALAERRDEGFGLRTLARLLAGPDATHQEIEVIRRRLHKYRPRPGGGAAAVVPTPPTRWEIEKAMGLERDALAADPDILAASIDTARFLQDIAPLRRLWELGELLERGELIVTKGPAA